jgi:hypothetical protein
MSHPSNRNQMNLLVVLDCFDHVSTVFSWWRYSTITFNLTPSKNYQLTTKKQKIRTRHWISLLIARRNSISFPGLAICIHNNNHQHMLGGCASGVCVPGVQSS